MGLKITICSGDRPPMRAHVAVRQEHSGALCQVASHTKLLSHRDTPRGLCKWPPSDGSHLCTKKFIFFTHEEQGGEELFKHFVCRWGSQMYWGLPDCLLAHLGLFNGYWDPPPLESCRLSVSPSSAFCCFFFLFLKQWERTHEKHLQETGLSLLLLFLVSKTYIFLLCNHLLV